MSSSNQGFNFGGFNFNFGQRTSTSSNTSHTDTSPFSNFAQPSPQPFADAFTNQQSVWNNSPNNLFTSFFGAPPQPTTASPQNVNPFATNTTSFPAPSSNPFNFFAAQPAKKFESIPSNGNDNPFKRNKRKPNLRKKYEKRPKRKPRHNMGIPTQTLYRKKMTTMSAPRDSPFSNFSPQHSGEPRRRPFYVPPSKKVPNPLSPKYNHWKDPPRKADPARSPYSCKGTRNRSKRKNIGKRTSTFTAPGSSSEPEGTPPKRSKPSGAYSFKKDDLCQRKQSKPKPQKSIEKAAAERLRKMRAAERREKEEAKRKIKLKSQIDSEIEALRSRYRYNPYGLLKFLSPQLTYVSQPTRKELKKLFRKSVGQYHPDKQSGKPLYARIRAEEIFKVLNDFKEQILAYGR